MKHLFILAVFFTTGFYHNILAQDKSEIGVRLGYAVALDFTIPVEENRLRSNLGWGIDYLLWDNFYEFLFPLGNKGWKAYSGPGLGIRYWLPDRTDKQGWGLALVGQIGIKKRLTAPLTIGIDWSPFYDVVKNHFNNYGTFSVRIRL